MNIMEMATPMIDRLSTLTADAVKRQGQADGPAVKLSKSTAALLSLISSLSDEDKAAVFSAGVRPNALIETERAISTLADELKPATGSDDRSEGDKLAAWLVASIEAALIDGDDRERAETAVEAWTSTAPKTRQSRSVSASGTSAAFGPLGFTVEACCDRDGFKASTTRDNINSIRDQIKRHEADKHGASKDQLGRSSTFHTAATKSLDAVMHDDTTGLGLFDGWQVRSSGKTLKAADASSSTNASTDASKAA
jgi:hypothetical protein